MMWEREMRSDLRSPSAVSSPVAYLIQEERFSTKLPRGQSLCYSRQSPLRTKTSHRGVIRFYIQVSPV